MCPISAGPGQTVRACVRADSSHDTGHLTGQSIARDRRSHKRHNPGAETPGSCVIAQVAPVPPSTAVERMMSPHTSHGVSPWTLS